MGLGLLFAFVAEGVASLVLATLLGWRVPGRDYTLTAILFMFLIIFFAAWARGAWFEPLGPALCRSHWDPFLLIGFFLALPMVALVPPLDGLDGPLWLKCETDDRPGPVLQ